MNRALGCDFFEGLVIKPRDSACAGTAVPDPLNFFQECIQGAGFGRAARHVHLGKIALVKSLSGTDTDRLPEEKARGITIELGFAHLDLAAVDERFSIGITDVPGHEDFVKTMGAAHSSLHRHLRWTAPADDRKKEP